MATTMDASPKHWWSKSKGTDSVAPKSKQSALGSLFGIKAKKHIPTLQIQEHSLPFQDIPPDSRPSPSYPNRPPSKSVSSTRSRTDSSGPRTPSDLQHQPYQTNAARHSLLTLSDTDPFAAARTVSILTTTPAPPDPTRLSAYSNSSSNDHAHRSNSDHLTAQRTSYTSSSPSSPHNQTHAPESPLSQSPLQSPSSAHDPVSRLLTKESGQPSSQQPHPTSHGVAGPSPGPSSRPRGLTGDSFISQRSGTGPSSRPPSGLQRDDSRQHSRPSSRRPSNASSQHPPVTSPRVIVRQASLQHMGRPAPPPTQQLPAPPSAQESTYPAPIRRQHSDSNASSTRPPPRDYPSPGVKRNSNQGVPANGDPARDRQLDRSQSSRITSSPSGTLKKAVSHQSLLKRVPFSPSEPSPSPASPELDKRHKGRGAYPQPRIPVPAVPLRHSNSSATLNENNVNVVEKRTSSSSRKRLFSGSSICRSAAPRETKEKERDDDAVSMFSMKSENDFLSGSFFQPWGSTQPSHPSFWEEPPPEASPASPARSTTSLAPVSPTLGRLDLNTRDAPPISFTSPTLTSGARSRGFSVRSTTTMASVNTDCDGESIKSGHTSDLRSFHRSNTVTTPRSNQPSSRPRTATASSSNSSKRPRDRPSTAGENKVTLEQSYFAAPTPPVMASLPPPPRPKARATIVTLPEDSPAKPVVVPTPSVVSLPPPPRRPRAAISYEKAIHRRSIMKKPSFLEISDDDDTDDDDDFIVTKTDTVRLFEDLSGGSSLGHTQDRGQRPPPIDSILPSRPPPPVRSESFLDFARESFDTARSD